MGKGRPRTRGRGLTLAVTPRGRGRGRGGRRSTVSTRQTRPKPWEGEDDDYAVDYVSDLEDEEEVDLSKEANSLDFDDVEDDVDLDAPVQRIKAEEEQVPDDALCPWLELPPSEIPLLELPSSSQDLILPSQYLMGALEVYEVCRSFYRSLFISPFLFEDLCSALTVPEHSPLLAELHISLFKAALRDDDEEQVTYAATDTNNAFNVLIQLLEPMTYAEILRQYAESDGTRVPCEVLRVLAETDYPYVGPEERLIVISWLCQRFLQSQEFKKIIKNDGRILPDDKCRDCNRPGDLLPCDNCEAAYHLDCAELVDVPEGQWLCPVCEVHRVKGVSDCLPLSQTNARQPLRMAPIGRDRHGRVYWFVARRIFVHDEGGEEVYYYTTAPQLHELLTRFDSDRLELALCRVLREQLPVIVEQMAITMELTNERREALAEAAAAKGTAIEHAYLHMDNLNRISDVVAECFARTEAEVKAEVKKEEEAEEVFDDETEPIARRVERMMGIAKGVLINTFWSGGVDQEQVLLHKAEKEGVEEDTSAAFRLGYTDRGFRDYRNHFSISDLAKPTALRVKERDKKKYMAGRFSLTDEGHFEWSLAKGKGLYGNENLAAKYTEWMIGRITRRLPRELMHRRWHLLSDKFTVMLTNSKTPEQLRECLLLLECGLRKTLFVPQWWNSLGSPHFLRQTAEQREEKQKEEQRRKKLERELLTADAEDDSIVWVKYTKLGGAPKHNIWRMKDEQYRVNGREALGGWIWRSATSITRFKLPDLKGCPEWEQKAARVGGVWEKLRAKKVTAAAATREGPPGCFSPSCTGSPAQTPPCYSVSCRLAARDAAAKAEKQRLEDREAGRQRELGGEIPYAMPMPVRFSTHNNRSSIFVLQKKYLKRLARQGGLNANFWFPGFNRTAKSNLTVWNYPSPRPLFDHCWRWNTSRARSFHAIALQLRILWACIKWSELTPDDAKHPRVVLHHADRDEERIVINHKEMPPDGLYERYEVSLRTIPIDGEADYEVATPSYDGERDDGKGSRKRKSARRVLNGGSDGRASAAPVVRTTWVDGVDLKLWEIIDYWQQRNEKRAKQRQAQQRPLQPVPVPLPVTLPQKTASTPVAVRTTMEGATHGVKRPRFDLAIEQGLSVRRTAAGKEFHGGNIRGGGKIGYGQPQREAASPRMLVVNSGQGGQRAAAGEEAPPVIPRYDSPSAGPSRQVVRATPGNVVKVPAAGTRVFMIRRQDGSTQLLRAVPGGGDDGQQRLTAVTEDGRRVVAMPSVRGGRGGGVSAQAARVLRVQPSPSLRTVPAPSLSVRTEDPFMRRMAVEKASAGQRRQAGDVYAGYYGESSNESIDAAAYHELASRGFRPPGRPPGRLASTFRYGTKTQPGMIQRTQGYGLSGTRQYGVAQQPIRRVTTYKQMCEKRSIDGMRRPMRSLRFDFEQNEEEERAISEAIAREEEIMRLEDEMKSGGNPGHQSEFASELWQSRGESTPRNASPNLAYRAGDSADTKIIKHMLDTMMMQVCKWDRLHGWYKQHCRNLAKKTDIDPRLGRRVYGNYAKQNEQMVTERMEWVKREINKRRSGLEMLAESELGVPAPWRRSRGRPTRVPRFDVSPVKKPSVVVDPREISLGSPSQISLGPTPSSSQQRSENEGVKKEDEEDVLSIGERVHRKRTSDSESSSKRDSKPVLKKAKVEESEGEEEKIDPLTARCTCDKDYNPKKVYIKCSGCSKSFHAKCMGIGEKKAKKLPEWKCTDCEQGKELYCICRTPYDESRFYVGCDACEGWYHPACVGITQHEAETVAEYICPSCAASTSSSASAAGPSSLPLSRADYPLLWSILDALMGHRSSWPFRQPISLREHPNYLEVVKKPMDLSTMRRKLEELEYQSLSDIAADFNLMLENARLFHGEDPILNESSATLEDLFQHKLQDVCRQLAQRTSNRKPSECQTVDSCLDIDTDQLIDAGMDPAMFQSLL